MSSLPLLTIFYFCYYLIFLVPFGISFNLFCSALITKTKYLMHNCIEKLNKIINNQNNLVLVLLKPYIMLIKMDVNIKRNAFFG